MATVHYHSGKFPPDRYIDLEDLTPLIGPAVAAVARYDGVLSVIPNANVLLAPLMMQEAVLSSRIEGTQATMEEVLEFEIVEEADSPSRRDDIQEVLNYRKAMAHAHEILEGSPLTQAAVRSIHRVLLSGARGENMTPGKYRCVPNWIGPPGCTIDNAAFVPIGVDDLIDGLNAWEDYIRQNAIDQLTQVAILHAEFEALHPFADGNGRVGRILIPLLMWKYGLIRVPIFYISAYLESNREIYYEGLRAVSRDNNWTGWCRFFLKGVQVQAEDNLMRAQRIILLYNSLKYKIADLTNSQHAIRVVDWIFENPIFRSTDFTKNDVGIPRHTAQRFLRVLREGGILKLYNGGRGRRANIHIFSDLLNTAEGGEAF